MKKYSVYEDIASRSGGDIYVGVVGPVRTGKSTFIRKFMQTLVIPSASKAERAVMTDELPQAAAGKTVMTTEPKFVPAKAVKISVSKGAKAKVRLVDCVGFPVEGAVGFEEDGKPRLVHTPWQEESMPFEQAAELGTEKVIKEHSTIGVLITTDGSIAEIDREKYISAEERTVAALKGIDKPFVIVLNTTDVSKAEGLRAELEEKYQAPVLAVDVEHMAEEQIMQIMQKALFEFPVTCIDVQLPKWLQVFPEDNWAVAEVITALQARAIGVQKMRDCSALESLFDENANFFSPTEIKMDLGQGSVEIIIEPKAELFYKLLSSECGESIEGELQLMQYVRALAGVKTGYEKIKDAFSAAEEHGYGIVYPAQEDYRLEKPKLTKKSGSYGVRFGAGATSYHIIKVDIHGNVQSVIGDKTQGEEFVSQAQTLYETGDDKLWDINIFGKTLRALVENELSGKSGAMPPELKNKMRRITARIVNEGKSNAFCILF